MDSENQELRASRMESRLPPPPTGLRVPKPIRSQGLSEMSEAQHNARSQSSMPPPSLKARKRDVPQPAVTSESKRKLLSEKAIEYPQKPAAAAPTSRSNISATTLVGASGIKPPSKTGHSRHASTTSASSRQMSTSSFASSVGPSSRAPPPRPKTAQSSHGRSVNGRLQRPLTAFGHRQEEEEPSEDDNGTKKLPRPRPRPPPRSSNGLHPRRLREAKSVPSMPKSREVSLTTQFEKLSINPPSNAPGGISQAASPSSPSPAPRGLANVTTRRPGKDGPSTPTPVKAKRLMGYPVGVPETPAPKHDEIMEQLQRTREICISPYKFARSPEKSPAMHKARLFLTKDSNNRNFSAWDVDGRLIHMEQHFQQLKGMMGDVATDRTLLLETTEMYKSRVSELQEERDRLAAKREELQSDLLRWRDEAAELKRKLEDEEWRHRNELEQVKRSSEHARDDLQRSIDSEVERLTKTHQEELEALKRHYAVELEDERRERSREVQELRLRLGNEQQDLHLDLQKKDREISDMRCQLENLKGDLDRESTLKSGLQTSLAELSAANMTMEGRMNSLRSQIEFLESDSKAQSDSFSTMEARLQEANRLAEEAKQKLIKEEAERRVLFNKYQELKGNIRVMCRVRPVLDTSEGDEAKLSYPDEKTSAKIGVLGPEEKSSLGNVNRKEYPFEFDRVFDPAIQNDEVFGEISQLVQSALDGYNVCIFCYGQTGSGKTYTMSSADGVIPRATHMIYDTITKLREKSWSYSMVGSFIEVYNEELHDLLTPNGRDEGKKKLEIKHDEARKMTTVTNCQMVSLDSADKVETMLAEAQNNRSVAATKANERSSRSHSVFILRLVGENSATGERCEGTLNLVDLAGSERVKHSGAEGDRMKEAQNINKSLSCLGDVIDALGRGTAHVPYRNSKLTHLLQYSLGGNSKTLMFVMVSPLEAHLKETLTSLRFAAKVHNTHIGTAKATKKIKDRDSKGDS